jgi:hypothetical protein
MSGQFAFDSRTDQLIDLRVAFRSNLPGPFVIIHPVSAPGYLIARVIRAIPYLHLGSSWLLRRKHEGTGA